MAAFSRADDTVMGLNTDPGSKESEMQKFLQISLRLFTFCSSDMAVICASV